MMPGSVYADGLVNLIHMDCLEYLEWVGKECVVVTAPPWFEAPAAVDEFFERCEAAEIVTLWRFWDLPPISQERYELAGVAVWHRQDGVQTLRHYLPRVEGRKREQKVYAPVVAEPVDSEHDEWLGFGLQQPLVVMRRALEMVEDKEKVVVDPFCGAGTTLVAARMMGRKAVGIEVNEKVCEIARRRLER